MLTLLDRLPPLLRTILTLLYRVGTLMDTLIHELGHALVQFPFGTALPSMKVLDLHGNAQVLTYEPVLLDLMNTRVAAPFRWVFRILTLLSGYSASIFLGVILIAAGMGRDFALNPLWSVFLAAAVLSAVLITLHLAVIGAVFSVTSIVCFIACLTVNPESVQTLSGEQFGFYLLSGICVLLLLCTRSFITLGVVAGFFALLFAAFALAAVIPFGAVLTLLGVCFVIAGSISLVEMTGATLRNQFTESDFTFVSSEFGGTPTFWLVVFYVGFLPALYGVVSLLLT